MVAGSGSPSTIIQQSEEIRILPHHKKRKLCEKAGLDPKRIATKRVNLAMKASLHLSWSQCRIQKRFLRSLGIQVHSEKLDRQEQHTLIGDHLQGEMIDVLNTSEPCNTSKKKYKVRSHSVPLVKVKALRKYVKHILDRYEKLHLLTWDTNGIPEDEVWIKIGADHGGGSFKMCLQVLNINSPNANQNTHVVLCYKGKDLYDNLNQVLKPMENQIRQLQLMTWNGKSLRVFLNGDYDFLCKLHGLSGAKGVHCCLWCHITSQNIQQSRLLRGDCERRSLVTLRMSHQKFTKKGQGKKSVASAYNNCIHEPMWPIRISHTTPPYLHILLGIVKKHHDLLTAQCHELDILLAETLSQLPDINVEDGQFGDFVKNLRKMTSLMDQRQKLRATSNVRNAALSSIEKEIEKVSKNRPVLHVQSGPVVHNLDKVLQDNKITVQAYHSRSLIGNHCHKYLKKEVIGKICSSVIAKTKSILPCSTVALKKAEHIAITFSELNSRFAKIHEDISHSNYIPIEDYITIQVDIDSYMDYFRANFPGKVLPKHHILEDHVLQWIKRWGVGMALHGEQGVESVHKTFNRLTLTHNGVRNSLAQLMSIMKEHQTHCSPELYSSGEQCVW